MKKTLLYFNVIFGFMLFSPTVSAQYCTTGLYTTGCTVGDQILTFSLGSYTNNPTTTCSTGGFGDFTTDTIEIGRAHV